MPLVPSQIFTSPNELVSLTQKLKSWTETSMYVSSNSSHSVTFTFRPILYRKAWTSISFLAMDEKVPLLFFHKDGFGIK